MRQIPEACEVQKENMKSTAHARELVDRTLALTARHEPGNLEAYMELFKEWRGMGGAQDYVVAFCHVTTRKLFQQAGLRSLTLPGAASLARELRAECRKILRHPDGYEIWTDY